MKDPHAKTGVTCDKKAAASLAASSVMHYFQAKKWKIISFFPNSICAGKGLFCKQNSPKSSSHDEIN